MKLEKTIKEALRKRLIDGVETSLDGTFEDLFQEIGLNWEDGIEIICPNSTDLELWGMQYLTKDQKEPRIEFSARREDGSDDCDRFTESVKFSELIAGNEWHNLDDLILMRTILTKEINRRTKELASPPAST